MNSRILNNSVAIRQEIQRFESVHPSIYAIYDLIDLIPDGIISQQIRDHVVCIEDSFVNSQEWTLSRSVPDLRLGIVGSLSSGKSALVHRYLTGSYMQEESPEGGRFKKEILVDNQSYLLLIRDEGGVPEFQFTSWVDAIILVFSLEDESSFAAVHNYYAKMCHYRNLNEIPLILVGTQDAISENNPRVIDDSRARKLAADLKRCTYYETCATYGLNVERVFQDACQKIVQQRLTVPLLCSTPTNSRPSTPNNHYNSSTLNAMQKPHNGYNVQQHYGHSMMMYKEPLTTHHHTLKHNKTSEEMKFINSSTSTINSHCSSSMVMQTENNNLMMKVDVGGGTSNVGSGVKDSMVTPISTPTTTRKNRRKSNLFTPSKKGDDKLKNGSDIGSGRAIPLKQGYLYKRSSKSLNKDWKKKYVTLCDDGRLTYHPSLHDYMDDVHGKEISLQYVTVKVPGQKPRGSKSIITVAGGGTAAHNSTINEGLYSMSITGKDKKPTTEKFLLSAFEAVKDPSRNCQLSGDEGASMLSSSNSFLNGEISTTKAETTTPHLKKRHRRVKSSSVKNNDLDDNDINEFFIVSLDNKQWHFDASCAEERDEWVQAIEQQILNSLQTNEISKTKNNPVETSVIQSIKLKVAGNTKCVDCDATNPNWASVNLGVLMCIECSGVHRNMGSHISRVRSIDLDDWPPGNLAVMLAIGNCLANSVWEHDTKQKIKPIPSSAREEKEKWIRSKYENKEFLPPQNNSIPLGVQLIEAVCASNIKQIITILAVATPQDVNTTVSSKDLRTPLHLACAIGNIAIAQLLVWHNADVKCVDQDGRSCLAYARAAASVANCNNVGNNENSYTNCLNLIDLLISLNCPESNTINLSGTISRRRRDGAGQNV